MRGFSAAPAPAFAPRRAPRSDRRWRRTAELRFGHPYIGRRRDDRCPARRDAGPWHGVPVFSAWVADPEDVPDADRGPRRA